MIFLFVRFVVSKAIKLIIVSVCEVTEKRLNVKYNKQKKEARNLFCDPLGVRNQDPILKRDVLYLLS